MSEECQYVMVYKYVASSDEWEPVGVSKIPPFKHGVICRFRGCNRGTHLEWKITKSDYDLHVVFGSLPVLEAKPDYASTIYFAIQDKWEDFWWEFGAKLPRPLKKIVWWIFSGHPRCLDENPNEQGCFCKRRSGHWGVHKNASGDFKWR